MTHAVHRFGYYQGIKELLIKHENNALNWVISAPTQGLTQSIAALEADFAEGYTSEINLLLYPWIKVLYFLEQGVMLMTDLVWLMREEYHRERRMRTFCPLITISSMTIFFGGPAFKT